MEKLLNFCNISGNPVKRYEGKRKYIATGDILDNKIISFEEVYYDNKPSRANQNVEIGDVIFAKMQNTKKVIIINEENVNNIYSTGFYVIKPKKNVTSTFLFWLFNSKKFNNDKDKNCKGATQKAINNDGLKKIEIKTLPSIKEQFNIVNELDTVQRIIDIRKKQLEQLDQLIKSQFVEMFGNINNKEKIKLLNNYFSRGKSPNYVDNSKIGVINQACIYWDYFKMENIKYQDELRINNSIEKMIRKNDILITSTGTGTLGRCNVYRGEDNKYIADGHVSILRLKEKIINPTYFKYYFMQDKVQKKLYSECVNGSTNQIELSKDKFLNFDVSVPDIEEQNKFAEFVKQIDKQKFEIQKSLNKMKELQESLMNKYFG